MMDAANQNDVILFGETNFRNKRVVFGIKIDDRRRHMYIVGKTGMGKSELLKILAIQDIQAGRGFAFIDPHGDPVEDLFGYIPEERIKDIVYVNPADLEYPIAFNVMEQVDPDKRHLVADGVMGVFKKIWVDVWSSRMEYILNNTILALLEIPDSTLLGINRMLAEKDYRNYVVSRLTDPVVKAFWTQEFAKYADRFASEATAAIQNKVGQFVSSTLIRNIIGQPKSTIDTREIMDNQKILLVNISKGRIGEDASRLLGALIITKLQLAAMSRVDTPEPQRKDFTLFVDEFQNFATASFVNIMSEARKYHLSLVVGHQYIAQMDESVRDAIFGNVGTIITFRVGAEDAEMLEKELTPEFLAQDIVNLGKREIYIKLMIDGLASRAFSARTMDTPPPLPVDNRQKVIEWSREHYAARREEVEEAIAKWHAPLEIARPEGPSGAQARARFLTGHAPLEATPPQARLRPPRGDLPLTGYAPVVEKGPAAARPAEKSSSRPVRSPTKQETVIRPGPKSFSGAMAERAEVIKPISFSDALRQGPVDFKGRKLQPKPAPIKPKVELDVEGLRRVLEEAGAKKKEE
jgi:hypothetical protein